MTDPPPQFERFCRSCRHSLRGINSRRCPECGRAFDPDNPRTTLPNATRKFWFVLESICRYLIIACGFLVGFSILASVIGPDVFLFWMGAILVAPGLLFILLIVMLPKVPLSRRFRIIGVVFPVLFISIAWTQWPLCVNFAFHRSAIDKLANQVQAGNTVSTPHQVGMLRFHTVRQLDNGNVGFQLTGDPGGGIFLVRCAPSSQRVWYNTNWEINLGGGWYYVYED